MYINVIISVGLGSVCLNIHERFDNQQLETLIQKHTQWSCGVMSYKTQSTQTISCKAFTSTSHNSQSITPKVKNYLHYPENSDIIHCTGNHKLSTLTVYGGVGREIFEITLRRWPLMRWLTCEIFVCTTTAFLSCRMCGSGKGRGNGIRDSTS